MTASPSTAAVLIVQPNMTGHRPSYVRRLLEGARPQQRLVLATTPEGAAVLDDRVGGSVVSYDVEHCSARPGLPELALISRRVGAEVVVVLDGDTYPRQVLRRGGWGGSGLLRLLIMREHGQPQTRFVKSLHSVAKKAVLAAAAFLPEVDVVVLASAVNVGSGHLPRVPDPITYEPRRDLVDRISARVDLRRAGRWFLVAGFLDARKNISLVAEALVLAQRRTGVRLGLMLAGTHAADVLDDVQHARSLGLEVWSDDRLLSDGELDSYLEVADVVVIAHSNDGPSGIMGKAAAGGKQILAAGSQTLRHDCSALGAGAVWADLDRHALAAGIGELLAQARGVMPVRADPAEFVRVLLSGQTTRGSD